MQKDNFKGQKVEIYFGKDRSYVTDHVFVEEISFGYICNFSMF